MPGNPIGVSRYALVGDGILSKLASVGSLAAGFLPGGGTIAKIAKLAIRPKLPGARTAADIVREAIPNISPRTARTVSLSVAGAAAAAAGGLAVAPGIAGLTRQAIARGGATGLAARLGGASGGALQGMQTLTMPGFGRRRIRRMNPLNPKALKRATRRLAGFHHFAVSTASELRKLAPAPRHVAHGRK